MKILLRFMLGILLGYTLVYAQHYRYHVTPYIGKNFTDNSYRMGDSWLAGINFDTYFNNYLGIRTGYENLFALPVKGEDKDVSMNRFYLNLIAKNSEWFAGFNPYLAMGLGYEICTDNDCPGEWFSNATLGAEICLSDQVRLTPEVKAIKRARCCDNAVDYVASIGMTYAFGVPEVIVKEKVVKERVEVPVTKIVEKRVEVPVTVEVPVCKVPKITKDRCDNSYYIQVAGEQICPTCPVRYKNKKFLRKLKRKGYHYEIYAATLKNGIRYAKVLLGPYRCKRDAYHHICKVRKDLGCDAFVYSKKD